MTADFGVSCGHTEYSNIRFEDGTRHVVIFEAAHDLPELEEFRLELPIPYRDMPYRVPDRRRVQNHSPLGRCGQGAHPAPRKRNQRVSR